MQRMRAVLGFSEAADAQSEDISSKLDKLEDEIAELAASKPAKGTVNKDVATRLARLSSEIDAIAKVNAPAKRKTTAKKKTARKTTAAKKPAAKKATSTRKRTTAAKA